MTRLRRIKPSPAMVVASLALLLALAGTSVAAVSIVIPRNSVGTLQLKDGAVTASKVRLGSLLRANFRSGQVPAGPAGPAGPQGPAGPAGPAGAAGAAGVAAPGYVAGVVSASTGSSTTTTATSFGDVSNSSVNVVVPTGETDQIVAFFTADSACSGGAQLRTCSVRIVVDGNELNPAVGGSQTFDNNDLGKAGASASSCSGTTCSNIVNTFNPKSGSDIGSHTIVRYSGNLSAGTHVVKAQFQVSNAAATFKLANWALVVQRIKVS